jgi:hypothetical protein
MRMNRFAAMYRAFGAGMPQLPGKPQPGSQVAVATTETVQPTTEVPPVAATPVASCSALQIACTVARVQDPANANAKCAAAAACNDAAERMDAAHADRPDDTETIQTAKTPGGTPVVAFGPRTINARYTPASKTTIDVTVETTAQDVKDAEAMANTMGHCRDGDAQSCVNVCNWGKPGRGVMQKEIDYACSVALPVHDANIGTDTNTGVTAPDTGAGSMKIYLGVATAALAALLLLKR